MWRPRPYLLLVPWLVLGLALVTWGSGAPANHGWAKASTVPKLAPSPAQGPLQSKKEITSWSRTTRRPCHSRLAPRQHGPKDGCGKARCESTKQRKRQRRRLSPDIKGGIRSPACYGDVLTSHYVPLYAGPVALTGSRASGSHCRAASSKARVSCRQAFQTAQWRSSGKSRAPHITIHLDEYHWSAFGWLSTTGSRSGRQGGCRPRRSMSGDAGCFGSAAFPDHGRTSCCSTGCCWQADLAVSSGTGDAANCGLSQSIQCGRAPGQQRRLRLRDQLRRPCVDP